jgi:hypothetical protein
MLVDKRFVRGVPHISEFSLKFCFVCRKHLILESIAEAYGPVYQGSLDSDGIDDWRPCCVFQVAMVLGWNLCHHYHISNKRIGNTML